MPIKRRYITLIFAFLFFLFPSLIDAKQVYLGGENIGIEISNEGLIVTGTYDVKNGRKIYNPSADSDIKKGDILLKIEDKSINTLEELLSYIKENCNNKESVNITIIRNGAAYQRTLKLIKDNKNSIKTGLYIKDSILGIGTVTYFDPENKIYGALGHEMSDSSNKRATFIDGKIYKSDVTLVKKSENGDPGEKVATIDKETVLGDIQKNTIFGIYGEYVNVVKDKLIETATIDEVKKGKAYIYTVVENEKIEKFEIEITDIKKQSNQDIKGITFKIVDAGLLNISNGVVAGMSGSPIV
jgi:stage IV sporulation protein B